MGAGARWIHVVDLDAALSGVPANLVLLERICLSVEASGGLSPDGAKASLDQGAARAVLGAAWLSDLATVGRTVAELGTSLAVALDVRGGTVAPRGTGRAGPAVADVLPGLVAPRPSLIVYADVHRDGMMTGPDLGALSGLAELAGPPRDRRPGFGRSPVPGRLDALARVRPPLAGAIVGRALHQGALSLEDALSRVP